jgi:hypothetical protein
VKCKIKAKLKAPANQVNKTTVKSLEPWTLENKKGIFMECVKDK